MRRDWKKRMGCILLALTLTVSNVQPVLAAAAEDDGTGLCDHHMVHENCGYVEGEENSCTYSCALCIAEEKAIADQTAADAVSVQIAALPTVDTIKEMTREAQLAAYEQTQAAYAAYNALSEEQKALLLPAEEVFKPLFDYFNSLTAAAMDGTDSFTIAGACGDLTWELDEGGTLTISGEGEMQDYINSDSNRPPWYTYRKDIQKIVIEDGTSSIGNWAFSGVNMESIEIPESVTCIGDCAFYSCSNLNNIVLPDSVNEIGEEAFAICKSLSKIIIPQGIESIGYRTFYACQNLTSITIPESTINIGYGAFEMCSSLPEITLPDKVTRIDSAAFWYCSGLTEITLPDKVTRIDSAAFWYCSGLTGITFPDGITSIGSQLFKGNTNLSTINFEGSAPVKNGDGGIFADDIVATAYYPSENETWTEEVRQSYGGTITWVAYDTGGGEADNATSGTCGDLTWELDENGTLTISGEGKMPSYITEEYNLAPWRNLCDDIKKVVVGNGVTNVGASAFYKCKNLKEVILSPSVVSIDNHAFAECPELSNIEILDTVVNIGNIVFFDCTSLTSLTIPKSVKTLGYAFCASSGLKEIRFLGDAPPCVSSAPCFESVTATAYYPAGNETWTEEVRQSYGGTITWVAYDPNGSQSNYIFYPENGATEVGTVSASGEKVGIDKLTITFDKKIKKNSANDSRALLDFTAGTIAIYRKDDDTLVWKAEEDAFTPGTAGTEVCVDSEQTTLVIEPVNRNNMLDFDAEYYVVLDAGVISFEDGSTNDAITKGKWGFSTVPEPPKTCTLDELTSVDLLALADLCYSPSPEASKLGEITVQEMLGEDKWERNWQSTSIKNSELFANVANWIVYDVKENNKTGLGAYIFKNEYNEFVVAYRGSNTRINFRGNVWNDWIENNGWMIVGGAGAQIFEAMQFAKEVINRYGSDSVNFTGHSLGGALCDIVAARYSCKAESFNAAPFLQNAYVHYPEEMGERFSGVDQWLFFDHITESDFVGELRLEYKKSVIHAEGSYSDGTHSLESFLARDKENRLVLTETNVADSDPYKSNALIWYSALDRVYLGTAMSDRLYRPDHDVKWYIYEGNESGDIVTGKKNDVLVGGHGNDSLDGGRGSDMYYYYKGNGLDCIADISGQDVIHLKGFSEEDEISLEVNGEFVDIIANGNVIIRIRHNRENKDDNQFNVIRWHGSTSTTKDITSMLSPVTVSGRTVIACPVSVEVIDDATGNVVHTMVNAESGVGAAYTDYGYFYVYQDESGEYVKVADLFEGYSLRIVGEDEGTMDVTVYEVTEDGLGEPISLTDVPVTDALSATIEKKNDGKLYLIVDSDSDDETDKEIPFDGASTDDDTTDDDISGDQAPDDESIDIDAVVSPLQGLTTQNVTAGDKAKIQSVIAAIDDLLERDDLTDTQRQELTEAKEAAVELLNTIATLKISAQNVSDMINSLGSTVEPDDEDTVAKIMAAKKAYDELNARAKALISAEQKAKLDTLVKATTDYKIIKGNNGKWWKNSGRTLSFTVNAPFSKFESVEIDGKTIAESNYIANSGSTIITLKSSYLQTLSTGEHTITVVFTDNEASGSFKVQKATSSPFTGDTFQLTLWISVMVVAGVSLVVLLYRKRKQK